MLQTFKVTGIIVDILDTRTVTTSSGKTLTVLSFILKYLDKKTKHISFQMLGENRIDKFLRFNDIGKKVTVHFSIDSNIYKDKYINNIIAYNIWTHREISDSNNIPDFPIERF